MGEAPWLRKAPYPRTIAVLRWILSAGVALLVSGCDYKPKNALFVPNLRPIVTLTTAPIDTTRITHYVVNLRWAAHDPDGVVEHFLYAVDPPSQLGSDTAWVKTEAFEQQLVFEATTRDPAQPLSRFRGFHVFVIKAIDNQGAQSVPETRAFFSHTVAPTVSILAPRPSALTSKRVAPSARITWHGADDDVVFNEGPVQYKFILLGPGSEFPMQDALNDPMALHDYYAPEFAGWDSVGGDTTETVLSNLTPGQQHLFVVVAFDEAGAYAPVFHRSTNMLLLRVEFSAAFGPKLTLFNDFFLFKYLSPSYSTAQRTEIVIDVVAGQEIPFNWFAEPHEGTTVRAYRWALDIESVFDDTPRTDEATDVTHWSFPRLNINAAVVGPFEGGEEHRFYVDVEDDVGLRSLAVVRFRVVPVTLEEELLIVNDTRFIPDSYNVVTRCVRRPAGRWPTAAELDTFLFARGGFPWQCYPFDSGQPTPPSPPGLFAGYRFDTLGTRGGASDLTVPLTTIGRYRRVIWMNDVFSSVDDPFRDELLQPALRQMSLENRPNWLRFYAEQGGEVWALGGGVATAATVNQRGNDQGGMVFSAGSELRPGVFMYDLAHWRSQIKTYLTRPNPVRYTGRFGDSASITRSTKYANLPPQLESKIPPTDPLEIHAPTRNFSEFFLAKFSYELLERPNRIIEDFDPNPDVEDRRSTLDTLYIVKGSGVPQPNVNPHNVVMTCYHGQSHSPFIFMGFDIWNLQHEHGQALVDFVLQDLWGMPKDPTLMGSRPIATQAPEGRDLGSPRKDVRHADAVRGAKPQRARGSRP